MDCPACNNSLNQIKAGSVLVDVCDEGCGGLWFDSHELNQVDESHEAAGEHLLKITRHPDVQVDLHKKRSCPKCDGVIMMKHFMSTRHEIEVDECPNCGGFWLDAGELGQIRNQFESEAEREQAAKKVFSDTFGEDLARMLKENKEKAEQANNITKLFRFICPSYYIKGKQSWGAY